MEDLAQQPVIVGIGQLANNDADRIVHPGVLLEEAARAALADSGADLAPHIGYVGSTPLSIFSDDDGARIVAERLGLAPGARSESHYSGASPQRLLAEAVAAMRRGETSAALVVGGVGEASIRRARQQGLEPPAAPTSIWSQGSGATESLGRRLKGGERPPECAEVDGGALMPSAMFALVESAIAAAAERPWDRHRQHLGELLVPFTEAAAALPDVAWFPTVRTAEEIATPSADNRLVAEPYTKLMCSFPTVDLAAAVLVCTVELADRLGVPADRRVHLWSLAAGKEPGPPSLRPDMGRSLVLRAVADRAVAGAGIGVDDIATFDLYSCFPAAVELAVDALDLPVGDPRPLTLTGGLPFFGGPGASYSLHSMVNTVAACRERPGQLGAVVGLGGLVNDFAVGVYSTEAPDQPVDVADLGDVDPPAGTGVAVAPTADGPAVVEAMTVLHERDEGPVEAPVVARLADGRRVGARAAGGAAMAADLSGSSLVGGRVLLRSGDDGTTYEPA